jgi:hypothetical protein
MRHSLAFWLKKLPDEKSRKFNFGKYGGQSAENQNSAMAAN